MSRLHRRRPRGRRPLGAGRGPRPGRRGRRRRALPGGRERARGAPARRRAQPAPAGRGAGQPPAGLPRRRLRADPRGRPEGAQHHHQGRRPGLRRGAGGRAREGRADRGAAARHPHRRRGDQRVRRHAGLGVAGDHHRLQRPPAAGGEDASPTARAWTSAPTGSSTAPSRTCATPWSACSSRTSSRTSSASSRCARPSARAASGRSPAATSPRASCAATRNVRLIREGTVVHEGRIASLRRFNEDAREVTAGLRVRRPDRGLQRRQGGRPHRGVRAPRGRPHRAVGGAGRRAHRRRRRPSRRGLEGWSSATSAS